MSTLLIRPITNATLCLALLLKPFIGFAQNPSFEWAKSMGGVWSDGGNSIAIDASGNTHIVGYFNYTVDFDPGPNIFNLTANGGYDIFIQKLDVNGDFVWVKQIGGGGHDVGQSIALDGVGNIYTTGNFSDSVDFDPGPGIAKLYTCMACWDDIFIHKLDANGNFLWAKSMGGHNADYGINITVDGASNVYTTGFFRDTVDFDPNTGTHILGSTGDDDIFIQKLDSQGNFIWAHGIGGTDFESGYGIAVDTTGNVYTTGFFEGTVDFDPGYGASNLTSKGKGDVFILKLDVNGNFDWAKQMGGLQDDVGGSIAIDALGNIYSIGGFQGTVDFDPGSGIMNLNSHGSRDIFVQKLNSNGNILWAKNMGGTDWDLGLSLAIDYTGNIYTTGSFAGTADFNPNTGTINLTSAGSGDIYIQKLNSNGDLLWVERIGGTDLDQGLAIAVDGSNNVYTSGRFKGIVDFNPGTATVNLTSLGDHDIFIQKLSQPWITGFGEHHKSSSFKVFPNPFRNQFVIEFSQEVNEAELVVVNLFGKKIIQKVIYNCSSTIIEFDGAQGVYFLTIRSTQGEQTIKLIKK